MGYEVEGPFLPIQLTDYPSGTVHRSPFPPTCSVTLTRVSFHRGLFLCLCPASLVCLSVCLSATITLSNHSLLAVTCVDSAESPPPTYSRCLRLLWPEAEAGKLRPAGQTQPATCICILKNWGKIATGTWPHEVYGCFHNSRRVFGSFPQVCKPLA